MTNEMTLSLVALLNSDLASASGATQRKPLLAHYTSMDTLEKIVRNHELWLSHPLLMNDYEEVNHGISLAVQNILASGSLRAVLKTPERLQLLHHSLAFYVAHYQEKFLFNTYVLCMSEHDIDDFDGRLSMWRGYGGNGKGAAIVFDTTKLTESTSSPLLVDSVTYASPERRKTWCEELIRKLVDFIYQHDDLVDESILNISRLAFERIKLAALFSKHKGFEEEREWRAVYMSDRDDPTQPSLGMFYSYHNGSRGIEPVMRYKLVPEEGITAPDLSLDKIIDRIIIGPNKSSPLSLNSVKRMLLQSGQPVLAKKTSASTIPFRSSN